MPTPPPADGEVWVDLPDKVYLTREVDFTPDQEKLYKKMKDEALAEIEGLGAMTALNALTKLLRLRQLLCGIFVTEEGVNHDVPHNRYKAMLETIDEMQGKVVIWSNFRPSIIGIQGTLIKEYGEESVVNYYGSTCDEERGEAIDRFQNDPKCRFFNGNPAVGGMGITLTAGYNMIYFSNDLSLEKRIQSEDRIHRIGQTNKCNYVDLVIPNTIDGKILKSLKGKLDLATMITFDEIREWLV